MSKIEAWRCDRTGKLFDDRAKYIKYLRKQVPMIRTNRNIERAKKNWPILEAQMVNDVASADDLSRFLWENWGTLFYRGLTNPWDIKQQSKVGAAPVPKFVKVEFRLAREVDLATNPRYKPQSNTTVPDNRAWRGRLRVELERNAIFTGSDMFWQTPIIIGSGGGGGGSYSYDVTLWRSDWPGLARAADHARTLSILMS